MGRRRKRMLFLGVSLMAMFGVTVFILIEFKKSLSFFFSTSELLSKTEMASHMPIRVGGVIVSGSIKNDGETTSFIITDQSTDIKVIYKGVLPPLFGEGMGAIAKGRLVDGEFLADELLAKHDERYMPKKYTVPNPAPQPN